MYKLVLVTAMLLGASALPAAAQDARTVAVPQDVAARVAALPAAAAARFCRRPEGLRSYLGRRPPARVHGYNSRMDNAESVEGAVALQRIGADMSQAAAFAYVTRDARTKADMLDVLAHFARSGAYTSTVACTRNGHFLSSCTSWTRPDGRDSSAMKDFDTVQMAVASMQRGYYLAAADFMPQERSADHAAIRGWFDHFNGRMKTPNDVYFGLQMGWHWPKIDADAARRGPAAARNTASRLGRGLEKLLLADGSIRNRTTRGDRALWYHNSALNETVYSMEIMRATGARVPRSLEQKLHGAVNLFVRSVSDHSAIDPWARQAHNARYTPNRQDWRRDWQNNSWGGSWWHIYAYRYPDRPEAQWLSRAVGSSSRSAFVDEELGVGVGCIYNAARAAR